MPNRTHVSLRTVVATAIVTISSLGAYYLVAGGGVPARDDEAPVMSERYGIDRTSLDRLVAVQDVDPALNTLRFQPILGTGHDWVADALRALEEGDLSDRHYSALFSALASFVVGDPHGITLPLSSKQQALLDDRLYKASERLAPEMRAHWQALLSHSETPPKGLTQERLREFWHNRIRYQNLKAKAMDTAGRLDASQALSVAKDARTLHRGYDSIVTLLIDYVLDLHSNKPEALRVYLSVLSVSQADLLSVRAQEQLRVMEGANG